MKYSANSVQENNIFDVAVIGAGHAGCEAALASARLGMSTVMFTTNIEGVAMMPCNPNIGGTSKGHLVREIDALGGEMGKVIDKAFIQSKMLNRSKGPAVHSLRAQADKIDYHNAMMEVIEAQDRLTLVVEEVSEILSETEGGKKRISGLVTTCGHKYECKAVILCTGTYLKARCIYGEVCHETGPKGLPAATYLSESLKKLGIELRRYKTGTPARIAEESIDFSKMEEQFGDEWITPFSFTTDPESIQKDQISCFLTYTCDEAHEIIRQNIHRSPLFSGVIEGTGPRYCPSIEDKVVKFPDKKRHQIFLEPEGLHTNEWYVAGMSSSLPADVQEAVYRLVPGLENCEFIKYAYAIEYDCIDARLLRASLEFKDIKGLYSAGQFNGSSGYEEAAAQGLMAGINAARAINLQNPIVLDRSQGYIGVLIDDLVTKESHEPYRMMTSRAEYRLLLRQDNADERLTSIGHEIGLIDDDRYEKFLEKQKQISEEIKRLDSTTIGNTEKVQTLLTDLGSTPLKSGSTLGELLRRPEISYKDLEPIDRKRQPLGYDVIEEVEINMKYDGYIERQNRQVEHFKKMEGKLIPEDMDYSQIHNLRTEAVQKLSKLRPANLGQASRISGVSPSDVSVLLIYLETMRGRKHQNS